MLFLAALVLAVRPGASAAQQYATRNDGLGQRQWMELGAVGLTGAGHLTFSALDQSRLFIPIATLSWSGYLAYRARTEAGFLTHVGLARHHLGSAFRDATLVALGASVLMAGVGWRRGTLRLHPDMIPLFLLYPVWGLVQQTLVQGLVAANLDGADGWPGSHFAIVPLSAAAFSAVHIPNWHLTAATFAAGLAFTPLYLKHRSLWPLGLYHGVLGVLFYFWILDENPWQEVIREPSERRIRTHVGWSPTQRPVLTLHVQW